MRPLKSRLLISIVTLTLFLGTLLLVSTRILSERYLALREHLRDSTGVDILHYDRWILLALIAIVGVILVRGLNLRGILDELGLNRRILPAIIFAALATLPMFIGYGLAGQAGFAWIFITAIIIAPFIEELFFRGWAFRQLAQRAGWGFWPAALLTGIIFGLMHVPIQQLLALKIGLGEVLTVLLTGAGGVFYAWLFQRWGWNLWVPIMLHALMNASWAIFNVSEGAVGGLLENLFRAMTITAAVFLTLYRDRIPLLRDRGKMKPKR